MSSRYPIYDLKIAILEYFEKLGHEEKFNFLGRGGQPGNLEGHFHTTFAPDEKELSIHAFDELVRSRHLVVSTTNVIGTGNWYKISAAGKRAVQTRALDEIDLALDRIDPKLKELRYGAHSALGSEAPDSIRQGAHSMRELIRQSLDKDAPNAAVINEQWYSKSTDTKHPVTRKQKIRLAMEKRGKFSTSDVEVSEKSMDLLDKLYDKLSGEAHKDVSKAHADLEDLIKLAEVSIRQTFC